MIKQQLARSLQNWALLRWALSLGIRWFAPRNYVGAVGAVFNDAGQVLLVEHVFRPDYAWGLPGGWVEQGENPAVTVQRELKEELNLTVQVKKLLFCEPQGREKNDTIPPGLGLAYYCRLVTPAEASEPKGVASTAHMFEVLSIQWVDPDRMECKLAPLQEKAVLLGKQEFERDQA